MSQPEHSKNLRLIVKKIKELWGRV